MRSDILTKELMDLKDRFFDMDTQQQAIFLDLVDPQPEPQAVQKIAAKKPRKPRGRSARAASLSETLGDKIQRRGMACTLIIDSAGSTCGDLENSPIHDPKGGYSGYHEFQPPVQAVATGD